MADTDSKYKDSFISQDELDRLLADADSLGPEAFGQSDPAGDPPADNEEMISQDDIDALLSLADGPADTPASENSEVITQDDIDALLNTRPAPPETSAKALTIEDDDDLDVGADLDLVTPEDIRKLLRSDAAETASPSAPMPDPDTGGLDTITAEDLMGLTGSQEIKAEAGPLTGDDDALITQEDINAILAGATPSPPPAAAEPSVDVPPAPAPTPAPAPPKAQTPDKEESLISQEDIDSLLAGAGMLTGDESPASTEAEEDNLISQEDIDKLLMGKSDGVGAEADETLIDQDDIDRLLNAAQPFDDIRLSTAAPEKLISQEDIDKLLSEDLDRGQSKDERLADQVILEADPAGKKPPRTDTGPWYRSRLFVSVAAVGLVLLVSLASLVLFSGKTEPPLADQVPAPSVGTPTRPDTVGPLDTQSPPLAQDIIQVTMNGFLVPAPANTKGMAYIALDMTLEISDAPTDPIKDYEPFFRNIVYEVISKAFVLQSETRIVEADLKKMIKEALNDALSEGSVSRIDFNGFTAG